MKGFTLLELLVSIVILGVLGAIAWPAFVNQAARAREAEAVYYLGVINRAQQEYYVENLEFAQQQILSSNSPTIPLETDRFSYRVTTSESITTIHAIPKRGVRAYVGVTATTSDTIAGSQQLRTETLICKAQAPPDQGGATGFEVGIGGGAIAPSCPDGYDEFRG